MRIYTAKPKKLLFSSFLTMFFALFSFETQAWIGYEEDTNIMIDILPDTEVEIGNDISYYDFYDKAYHNAYVTFTDWGATGLRLEVKDIESGKTRIFIMDEES